MPVQMPQTGSNMHDLNGTTEEFIRIAWLPTNVAKTHTHRHTGLTYLQCRLLNKHNTAHWRTAQAELAPKDAAAADAQIVDLSHTTLTDGALMSQQSLCCTSQ